MVTKNIINIDKNSPDKISGNVFYIFVKDSLNTSVFDADMTIPIIFGNKNIALQVIRKNLPLLCRYKSVIVHFYKLVGEKYIHKGKYDGDNNEENMGRFFGRVVL